ncbi:hypothetical protein K445DRAFT_291193 [Daldinia sp. EC12]|nr:hypothetical protein K445DRAFT_291193 [Daldinia sp. EC12]
MRVPEVGFLNHIHYYTATLFFSLFPFCRRNLAGKIQGSCWLLFVGTRSDRIRPQNRKNKK